MEDKITQHSDHFPSASLGSMLVQLGIKGGYRLGAGDSGKIIKAIVNGGRWMAQCPTCGSAAVVSVDEPLYACPDCGSPETGGSWYRVVFPRARLAIEAELLKRPRPYGVFAKVPVGARVWVPGETVEDLAKQRRKMFPVKAA